MKTPRLFPLRKARPTTSLYFGKCVGPNDCPKRRKFLCNDYESHVILQRLKHTERYYEDYIKGAVIMHNKRKKYAQPAPTERSGQRNKEYTMREPVKEMGQTMPTSPNMSSTQLSSIFGNTTRNKEEKKPTTARNIYTSGVGGRLTTSTSSPNLHKLKTTTKNYHNGKKLKQYDEHFIIDKEDKFYKSTIQMLNKGIYDFSDLYRRNELRIFRLPPDVNKPVFPSIKEYINTSYFDSPKSTSAILHNLMLNRKK